MAPGGGGVVGDEVEFVRGAGVKVELDGYAGLAEAQGGRRRRGCPGRWRPCEPAGARTAPGSGSSGDHVYSHPAWPGQRQGLAGLLAGYPVTSSAR
jgi:hypothetical protein